VEEGWERIGGRRDGGGSGRGGEVEGEGRHFGVVLCCIARRNGAGERQCP